MADYSSTPLVKKLGIKAGDRLLLVNQPDHFDRLIGPWPPEIEFRKTDDPYKVNYIHLFTQEMGELNVMFPKLKSKLEIGGALWISWPKGSSTLTKDLNGNDVRRVGLEHGLVDVKVCAIDEDWSGLKFMFRSKSKN